MKIRRKVVGLIKVHNDGEVKYQCDICHQDTINKYSIHTIEYSNINTLLDVHTHYAIGLCNKNCKLMFMMEHDLA